jgi:hypothetical protein
MRLLYYDTAYQDAQGYRRPGQHRHRALHTTEKPDRAKISRSLIQTCLG